MIEYRPARSSDAEAVAALHARSWRESYRGSFRDAFLDGDLIGERLRVWRERLERPRVDQFVQLAVEGTSLVGFVCAYGAHDPEWGSLVDNLHVAKDAKRGGIGASLMRQAGAWLDSRYPDSGVHLFVLEVNAPARRFYERLGARNAGVSTMETHGGAIVRSCRYVWPSPRLLGSHEDGTFFEPAGGHAGDPLAAFRSCIEHGRHALLFDAGALPAAFFDLRTGLAGELVQKLVDYRVRMAAVVPDLAGCPERFREFAREANRGRQFRFFATREGALAWLRDR